MRVVFLVNDVATVSPVQATARWMARCVARGHTVLVLPVDEVDVLPGGVVIGRGVRWVQPVASPEAVAALSEAPIEAVSFDDVDAVIVRTNPGRDPRRHLHDLVLQQLTLVEERGTPVLNAPRGLARARSKLYLSSLPEDTVPPTLITRSIRGARDYIASLQGPAVCKPLVGTRGQDVFLVQGPDDPNVRQILDVLFRDGPAMVQGFVPGASEGDIRILLVDGELLARDGAVAAVRRRPGAKEFRSNVHLGGEAEPVELTDDHLALVQTLGPYLRADGLFLVGLDVIGSVVVEINVFAPGGFGDIERFTGVDLLDDVVDAVEAKVRG